MSHSNPHSLLTPRMRDVLHRMARAGQVPLHAMTPVQARQAYELGGSVLDMPPHDLPRVESRTVAARDGFDIPVRLYAPSAGVLPVLVYFHGGGFTVGSIATHDALCRRLSHLAHCAVVSVGYRLAPEYPFPYAVNDAWDVVAWLAAHGADWGLDGQRLAVGGDSAGGTLATVCGVYARDAGVPLALQMLLYPGVSSLQTQASHRTFGHGFLLERAHIDYFFGHYLPDAALRNDWRFAPLEGVLTDGQPVDLSGVAPVWLGLAECDPMVDEGLAYGDALRLAGVPVDLALYHGVVHEFIKMGRAIPEALQAQADAAHAVKVALNAPV